MAAKVLLLLLTFPPRCPGAHRAMDEFFEGKPEGPVVDLLNGQGLSIKRMPAA